MRQPTPTELSAWRQNTLMEALDIRVLSVAGDRLTGDMPVDGRTKQIYGLLHGGASVALAETLGSLAATLSVDAERFRCVGLEINANHLRAATSGRVTGTARPLHVGRTTHVWQIDICNEGGQLVCVSRITMAVLPCRPPQADGDASTAGA